MMIVFSIWGVFCVFLLWRKYGNDDKVIKKKTEKAPKDLNGAELGFSLKGEAINEDILTLFITLANNGYLKVKEEVEEVLFAKEKSFKVIKVKDYDGKNEYEKMFFDKLFTEKNELTKAETMNILKNNVKTFENKIETKKNISKIFEDTSASKGLIALAIGISILFFTLAFPLYMFYGKVGLVNAMLFIILEMLSFDAAKAVLDLNFNRKRSLVIGAVLMSCFMLFLFIPVSHIVKLAYFSRRFKIAYCVGLFCYAIITFFIKYMSKRTKYGMEVLGEAEGFKEFLLNKEAMCKIANEDKKYFCSLLPYVYVLGIENEWFREYGEIEIDALDWYESEDKIKVGNVMDFTEKILVID